MENNGNILEEETIKKGLIGFQISLDMKKQFIQKCKKYGGTSHVLRELLIGFVDGRVIITPPGFINSLYNTKDEVLK
jgi:hypothetical protein